MDMEEGRIPRIRSAINHGPGPVVVVVLVLAAVGVAITVAVGSRTETEKRADEIRAKGLTVLYVCKGCKATGETHKAFDAPFPIQCPKCGEVKAVAGFRCAGCRRIIEAQDKSYFVCPHCRYVYDQRVPAPGGGQSGSKL